MPEQTLVTFANGRQHVVVEGWTYECLGQTGTSMRCSYQRLIDDNPNTYLTFKGPVVQSTAVVLAREISVLRKQMRDSRVVVLCSHADTVTPMTKQLDALLERIQRYIS